MRDKAGKPRQIWRCDVPARLRVGSRSPENFSCGCSSYMRAAQRRNTCVALRRTRCVERTARSESVCR